MILAQPLSSGTTAQAARNRSPPVSYTHLGGTDLQLLGLGRNGHIGFNEPGPAFIKETHVVELSQSTIEANARFFESADEVPRQAITMGIGCIMAVSYTHLDVYKRQAEAENHSGGGRL